MTNNNPEGKTHYYGDNCGEKEHNGDTSTNQEKTNISEEHLAKTDMSHSHHEVSPKVEEWEDNYKILTSEYGDNRISDFFLKEVKDFISSLLLQKEEQHKREAEEAYERGYEWGVADEERRALEEDVLKDLPIVLHKVEQIKQEAILTERKRVNDILDGLFQDERPVDCIDGETPVETYGYEETHNNALKQAKHLINNTQEK